MAKKDRTGNRKPREQRKQFKVPELGYYLIVTDTEATERCYFTGLHVKRQVFSIKLSEVVAYHVAADLAAIISMVVLHFYVVDISLIETLITGSVLSVLVSAALLFLTFRRKRYITIRQRREEQGEAAPSKTVSVPAKQ